MSFFDPFRPAHLRGMQICRANRWLSSSLEVGHASRRHSSGYIRYKYLAVTLDRRVLSGWRRRQSSSSPWLLSINSRRVLYCTFAVNRESSSDILQLIRGTYEDSNPRMSISSLMSPAAQNRSPEPFQWV